MQYTYIIIEDHTKTCIELEQQLKNHPEFHCKGHSKSVSDGITQIMQLKPNLVFLDVELPDGNGFEILKETTPFFNEPPFIIILSDNEKYIRKAINYDVLFYLDKPVIESKLILALNKFKKRFCELKNHLTVKDKYAHLIIRHNDILYIQSDASYCHIHRINDKIITATKPMKEIAKLLPRIFLRVHKSYIININYVEKINTTNKIITLRHRQGLFEITENSKIRLDETFTIKDTIIEIPIGDLFLDAVRIHLLNQHN